MRCCVVFCFVFVYFEVGFVDCLRASQKGVCVSKHTVTKTRPKTVLVPTSQWCGAKKCTVKQTRRQKYTVVSNQLMCCKGFVYTSTTDSCAPVCSTGCANGTCIDPDICHCAPPLYLDPTTKNKCLTPTCDHPCVHGTCSVNNTCVCDKNYTIFNATHCAVKCTEGFELDSSLNCVLKCVAPLYLDRTKKECITPTCDHICVNGQCLTENTCVCNENYTAFNATHCAANCTDDFVLDSSLNCVPKCKNCTGNCKIGSCVCEHGYKLNLGKCEPVCDFKCVNGRCKAPNVCECDKGFEKKNASECRRAQRGSCVGECRADGTCLLTRNETRTVTITYTEMVSCRTGRCPEVRTRTEKQTKEVTDSKCCDLYEWDPDEDKCVPDCAFGCIGGECVGPNQCACKLPLVLHNSSYPNKCALPTCSQPCINGACTAINQCTCNEGFINKDTYTCVPHCTNCTNGDCINPGDCRCHEGYIKKEGQCMPQCKSGCPNGFCSAPGICTCNYGYQSKDGGESEDNTCKPICKKPCKNADCVAPGSCKCFDGYEPKGKHTEICVPKCKNECTNGFCSKPDFCDCNHGYKKENDTCVPVCEKPCINGYCKAPGKCECSVGYESDGVTDTCRPKCDLCTNDVCVAPNECVCQEGYTLKNRACVPTCEDTCVKGYCSAPNVCSCETGYIKDTTNSSICLKPCGPCDHGTCKDGKCVCEPDMDLINGTCVVSTPSDPLMSSGETTTGLASMQMTWLVGGAVLLLLLVLVLVVIGRLYVRRIPQKAVDDGNYGMASVACTIPNTLFRREEDPIDEEETNDGLLEKGTNDV